MTFPLITGVYVTMSHFNSLISATVRLAAVLKFIHVLKHHSPLPVMSIVTVYISVCERSSHWLFNDLESVHSYL